MSQENESLRERIKELEGKVEDCRGQLENVGRKLDRLEKMLLFLIDRAADRYVDASMASSERLKIRAMLRDTTTNAIVHEELRDERISRGMEVAFDQFYERLEEYGLGDVAQVLRGE